MPRSFIAFVTVALSAVPILFGQSSPNSDEEARVRWNAAWDAASAAAPFVPSALAREIAQAELGVQTGKSDEVQARRAFAAALGVERALRLGYTFQEARARLRQNIRIQSSSGTEEGERISGRLAKAERKNQKSGNAGMKAGAGSGFGGGAGAGAGKGKNGQ